MLLAETAIAGCRRGAGGEDHDERNNGRCSRAAYVHSSLTTGAVGDAMACAFLVGTDGTRQPCADSHTTLTYVRGTNKSLCESDFREHDKIRPPTPPVDAAGLRRGRLFPGPQSTRTLAHTMQRSVRTQ